MFDALNTSVDIASFKAVLTKRNGLVSTSTLTNHMVALDMNHQLIQCVGGNSVATISIEIAGLYGLIFCQDTLAQLFTI